MFPLCVECGDVTHHLMWCDAPTSLGLVAQYLRVEALSSSAVCKHVM